eukprot:1860952-Lingulodinium_polyedra.AAC.1
MAGSLLAHGGSWRLMAGSWLAHGWLMAGSWRPMAGHGWLMAGSSKNDYEVEFLSMFFGPAWSGH